MSKRSSRAPTTDVTQASTARRDEGCGKVCAAVRTNVDSTYQKILSQQPLSELFPFDYMFECYIWRAVFLTAFTLGTRFGGIEAVSAMVLTLLPRPLLFIIIYVLVPPTCLFLNKKYDVQDYTVAERRVLLVIVAVLLGVGSGAFNSCYFLVDGPPSYFMPGLVGLTVQLVGPSLGKSRRELLLASVGSALLVGIALAGVSGNLTVGALFSLSVAAFFATINLQIVIADILNESADMTETHITSLSTALYQHLFFSRFLGTYEEVPKMKTQLSLGKALFN